MESKAVGFDPLLKAYGFGLHIKAVNLTNGDAVLTVTILKTISPLSQPKRG